MALHNLQVRLPETPNLLPSEDEDLLEPRRALKKLVAGQVFRIQGLGIRV